MAIPEKAIWFVFIAEGCELDGCIAAVVASWRATASIQGTDNALERAGKKRTKANQQRHQRLGDD